MDSPGITAYAGKQESGYRTVSHVYLMHGHPSIAVIGGIFLFACCFALFIWLFACQRRSSQRKNPQSSTKRKRPRPSLDAASCMCAAQISPAHYSLLTIHC